MKKLVPMLLLMASSASVYASENVKYWAWLDDPNNTALSEMVADFNNQNDDIHVSLEIIPWGDYRNKLLTSTIAGEGPDAAAFKLTWTPEFISSKSLANLTPHIKEWKNKDDIADNLWNEMRDKKSGDTYLLPWEIQVLYMYYRPSLFAEAGITKLPKTWGEFLDAAKKLTIDKNGDGRVDQYGFGMRGARYGHEPWGSFVFSNVPDNKIFENGKPVFDTKEAREANKFFVELYSKYKVVPPTAPTDGFAQIMSNFKSGRTAMLVHHIKSSGDMVKVFGDDVSAFPMPKGKFGQWTSLGDTENVVFQNSKHQKAAFKFISWLAEAKQVKKWDIATGNVPVVKSIRNDEEFKDNQFMQVSFDSISFAHTYPITPSMGEWIELTWPETMQMALLGDMTPDEEFTRLFETMK